MGKGENDVDDPAYAAQAGETNFHQRQGGVPPKKLGGLMVDSRIAHDQIIQSSMLIRGASIVRHLHDPHEHLIRRRLKLLHRHLLWPWDPADEFINIAAYDATLRGEATPLLLPASDQKSQTAT